MLFQLLLMSKLVALDAFLFPPLGCKCKSTIPPLCPPPPICIPPPPCPPIWSCQPSNTVQECCNGCGTPCKFSKMVKRTKRETDGTLSTRESHVVISLADPRCNSEKLRHILKKNIGNATLTSKRAVQEAAEREFGTHFNVICANGHFSYITNTDLFCEQQIGTISCYAFRRLVN